MEKSFKNIRKIDKIKLIFIGDDLKISQEVKESCSKELKEFSSINSAEFLNIKNLANYDIIVLDMDLNKENAEEVFTKIQTVAPSTPTVVISSSDSDENISDAINLKAYSFLLKPFNFKNLKLAIIMSVNQTKRSDKIELSKGIYFDVYRDQFFKKGGAIIDFTKLEKSLLKLLINRKDDITDYDMIKDTVWKEKDMSIFTMRNIINKIRQKTYYEIIKNHSGRGYTIDLLKK